MSNPSRRQFFRLPAQAIAVSALGLAAAEKARIGVVTSSHAKLTRPSSSDDPLDYARVREMVWRAIEYGNPRAGSLGAKIRPGSWVVIKPNIGSLPMRRVYLPGDVTDMRVTMAVIEYVAEKSRAGRITLAEGGTYRRVGDPEPNDSSRQNGVPVDGLSCDWTGQFPGFGGSVADLLRDMRAHFPSTTFDYVDLSYDPIRDDAGQFRWMEVPPGPNGQRAFGAKSVYVPAKTIVGCDFLITVPVVKIHNQCGLTACLKNYVGTAPRSVYGSARAFSNQRLHNDYSVDGRIDPFIVDLASFHPPDYCVVDNLLGLQYSEHGVDRSDQQVRNNTILAGEDPVALDALAARLIGYQPGDIDYLHMASRRRMGSMELDRVEFAGDDPERLCRKWEKPKNWYGRGNREWLATQNVDSDIRSWRRFTAGSDTLHLARLWPPASEKPVYGAAVRVVAAGNRKGFLWVGARGRVTATLNGRKIMEEEGLTRYRVGQFQAPVELRSGENLLVFQLTALAAEADLSVLLVGPANDGDTVDGIRWTAG
jgi:uncharacterized protein (DUF362 family)